MLTKGANWSRRINILRRVISYILQKGSSSIIMRNRKLTHQITIVYFFKFKNLFLYNIYGKSLYVKLFADFWREFCIPLVRLVMEQAATVKTFVKAGRKPQEVISLLKDAYGDNALSARTVYWYYHQFKEGRESVTDGRKGREMPKKVCTLRTLMSLHAWWNLWRERGSDFCLIPHIPLIWHLVTSSCFLAWRETWLEQDSQVSKNSSLLYRGLCWHCQKMAYYMFLKSGLRDVINALQRRVTMLRKVRNKFLWETIISRVITFLQFIADHPSYKFESAPLLWKTI